ncbi:MAG: alpha/beta hydrolase [Pseudomonadota bacterium]
MQTEHFELPTDDEHTIRGTRWLPADPPKAVILLFHGLGEHHQRYGRFASAATERGFALVAHDHRGHGPGSAELGYFAASDGWQKLLDDGRKVREAVDREFGQPPVILLGHSMGSYIAQAYTMQHPHDVDLLVLSASTWAGRLRAICGNWLARFEAWRTDDHARSALLNKLGFGDFNKRFEPARTPLDWLSRDEEEVDRYIADPLCDGPYTCSLWKDLTAGIGSINSDAALAKIPGQLPILLTGGSNDPVGGRRGITRLAQHYAASGHGNVTVRIYEGGRHEMFNETNRDEFTRDLLDWIDAKLPGVAGT